MCYYNIRHNTFKETKTNIIWVVIGKRKNLFRWAQVLNNNTNKYKKKTTPAPFFTKYFGEE